MDISMDREKLDHFCNLEAGYVWTEQDCLDIIQLRSDLISDLLNITNSLEVIERFLNLPYD